MPSNEAQALAAALLAHYPGEFINELNVIAIADTLEMVGMDIAPEVCDRARRDRLRPPSSGHLIETARMIRAEMAQLERSYELPMHGQGTEPPPEFREIVARIVDKSTRFAEEEAERERAEAEWERMKAAVRNGRKMAGVCDGTGQAPVVRGGKRVCPGCGVEVPDLEVEVSLPKGRRRSWQSGEWA